MKIRKILRSLIAPRAHTIVVGNGFVSGSPCERQRYAEKLVAAAKDPK